MTPIARIMRRATQHRRGCWIWTGATTKAGYGRLRVGSLTHGTRRLELTHRIVMEDFIGRPLGTAHVMHTCDNPPCVNPSHLRLGTSKLNAEDREKKGRGNHVCGEAHGQAVLTQAEVDTIRSRAANGERGSDLAAEYNMSRGAVYAVIHRHTWT